MFVMFVMLELNNLLPGVTIDQGSVLSNIQTIFLPKKSEGCQHNHQPF